MKNLEELCLFATSECYLQLISPSLSGERAKAISPAVTVQQGTSLSVSVARNGSLPDRMTTLEVAIRDLDSSEERRLATFSPDWGVWEEYDVCLPVGTYQVVFTGTIGTTHAAIAITDVHLVFETNCPETDFVKSMFDITYGSSHMHSLYLSTSQHLIAIGVTIMQYCRCTQMKLIPF